MMTRYDKELATSLTKVRSALETKAEQYRKQIDACNKRLENLPRCFDTIIEHDYACSDLEDVLTTIRAIEALQSRPYFSLKDHS